MHNLKDPRERAVLVGVNFTDEKFHHTRESLDELELLAETAGAEVIGRVIQTRPCPDKSTYIGKGKVEEVRRLVKESSAHHVIFDDDLSPSQVRNVEKSVETSVIDRSGLILDIFARRARSNAAKIQVELAQLKYLLPRLTGMWTHLERQEGAIGTRGPGEKQLEEDKQIMRKKITELRKKLKTIDNSRREQRKRRNNLPAAAIVGYSNAGKSTLLSAMSKSNVYIEDKLFATLDATTRKSFIPGFGEILLTDTVGFIKKLPHHLIESFKSTLDEAVAGDIIIRVTDISAEDYDKHISVVDDVLNDIGAFDTPVINVFNKADTVDKKTIKKVTEKYPDALLISARKNEGLEDLKEKLRQKTFELGFKSIYGNYDNKT
ncbi:MAG: GTPase HflX [Fibrobacterota bacterium]